jgi:hypothetical protein
MLKEETTKIMICGAHSCYVSDKNHSSTGHCHKAGYKGIGVTSGRGCVYSYKKDDKELSEPNKIHRAQSQHSSIEDLPSSEPLLSHITAQR